MQKCRGLIEENDFLKERHWYLMERDGILMKPDDFLKQQNGNLKGKTGLLMERNAGLKQQDDLLKQLLGLLKRLQRKRTICREKEAFAKKRTICSGLIADHLWNKH